MEDYIDYSGQSMDEAPSAWSHKAFRKYFTETYWKTHRAGGAVPWTIKDDKLLSRLRTDYSGENLSDMMIYWHVNTAKPAISCIFANFYSDRINVYHKMRHASDEYSWD